MRKKDLLFPGSVSLRALTGKKTVLFFWIVCPAGSRHVCRSVPLYRRGLCRFRAATGTQSNLQVTDSDRPVILHRPYRKRNFLYTVTYGLSGPVPPEIFPHLIRNLQVSFSRAKLDLRLIASVKITASGEGQAVSFGDLDHRSVRLRGDRWNSRLRSRPDRPVSAGR